MDKDFKYWFLLSLSYDGSSYQGWVRQANKKKTIQDTLNQSIKNLIKKAPFYTVGASKTDAGVHALDQKVLLMLDFKPDDLDYFRVGLNRSLPLDIRVNGIEEVSKDFRVRNVKAKEYEYVINDGEFNLFTQRYELNWDKGPIDIVKLQSIFDLFVGEHNFFNFSGLSFEERGEYDTTRKIDEIKVSRRSDGRVSIIFHAKGFIRYQIRMIVAAALQSYENNPRSSVELIKQRLNSDNNKSPFNIDAKGLILKKISY